MQEGYQKYFLLIVILVLIVLLISIIFIFFQNSRKKENGRVFLEEGTREESIEGFSLSNLFDEEFKRESEIPESFKTSDQCDLFGEEVGQGVAIFDTTCSLEEKNR